MPESKSGVRAFFQRSIFLKLFLIYAATTLVLVLAISGFSRLVLSSDERFKQTRGKMLAHHLNHLMDQMGNPPSRERAVQLSRQLGLQIRLESAEGAWTTDPALPASSALHVRRTLAESDMQLGRYRGRRFAIMDRGSQRFLFFLSERPELEVGSAALLVGMIALILGGSYLMVRWLFRPLDWLTQGVTEIGRGNLHHQVPLRSPDELGQLTTALNDMTTRVRDMLRARDRLLLDVSHELRSPLTRMKVALEFVQEEPTREKLHQDIRQLEAMVTELLESERLNSDYGGVTLAGADLVPLVAELVETYRGQGPGARIVAAPSTAKLNLDKRRVVTALRNVLENALTHSLPDRGPVEVRVEKDAAAVRVSVQDHGPGIPIEEQPLIFEPFYRVDKSRTRSTGGYGLGLSLAKKIMVAHGGDIVLTSEPGRGSTFTLRFPLA